MNALLKYWHFDPAIMVFVAILGVVYFYFYRHAKKVQIWYFITAVILILLSVCSPLHWLGMHYLFSAHMISHVILFLVAAPLLVLAIPVRDSHAKRYLIRVSKIGASVPWLAWFLGIAIMWFWHIPAVFDGVMPTQASGIDGFLHHIQSISMVVVGLIFWWPIFGPFAEYRLPPLKGVLYLFTACFCCSILGLVITFAPAGMYSYYGSIPDRIGFSSVVRNSWGITRGMDKQIAGLIMWVPGCFLYLGGALYLLREWFGEKEETAPMVSLNNF